MEDLQLLREYAEQRSERAFTELVNRHVHFVYSTALRVVNESQLAEDVTQLVFIKLARKAGSISAATILTGWLYRTTHFIAETALRSEWRRRKREKLAMEFTETQDNSQSVWKEVSPLLETAMKRLRKKEQDAVLLRFFADKSLREVGQALGISDDAAQKRVDRAIEKMRAYFASQRVVVTAAALAPAIATHAIQAAPAGLASTLIPTSVGGGAIGATTLKLLKIITMAKIKSTAATTIAVLITLGAGSLLVMRALDQPSGSEARQASSAAFVLRGTVRAPDGKPLAGAFVRVATIGGLVRLYDTNAFPTNIAASVSRVSTNTAADGTFVIGFATVPPQQKAVVVVNDDAGYAVATADELSSNSEIVVRPWGRIEGVLRIGKDVGTNQMVSLSIWGSSETYEWNIVSHNASTKTDANGRFVFPRVAPGDIWLTRSVVIRPGEARPSGHHYVRVEPGEHVNVQFGGTGRAVMGRMEYESSEKLNFYGTLWAQDHGMRAPPNWREMSAEEKRKYVRSWRDTPQGERFKNEVRNYEFPVKSDGTFWVDDVRPGRYRMQVRTDAKVPKGQSPRLAAMAEIHIDVPEAPDNSEAPVDVGTLYPHAL